MGRDKGQGTWKVGGKAPDPVHSATVYPSLEGHGPGYPGFLPMGLGILGSCQAPTHTSSSSSPVPSSTPGSPSYPTQPSSAAIEDSGPEFRWCQDQGTLPTLASQHPCPPPTQGLWETPQLLEYPWDRVPPWIPPSFPACVCPTTSSTDLPSTQRNTAALFPRTGPCLGAWPCAQVGGQEQN